MAEGQEADGCLVCHSRPHRDAAEPRRLAEALGRLCGAPHASDGSWARPQPPCIRDQAERLLLR